MSRDMHMHRTTLLTLERSAKTKVTGDTFCPSFALAINISFIMAKS